MRLTRRSLLALPLAVVPAAAPAHALTLQEIRDPVRPPGGLDWDVLAGAAIPGPDGASVFTPEVQALANTRIRLVGYMTGVADQAQADTFMLSAYPYHCAFCYPGARTTMMPVGATRSIPATPGPVIVDGRLELLQANDTGFVYRLVDAEVRPYPA
jgi:hypothetical protein